MSSISKFTLASGGAVWLAIGVLSAPAQAALLDFNLTPNSTLGDYVPINNISFTLDTETNIISSLAVKNASSFTFPETKAFGGSFIKNGNNSVLNIGFQECFRNPPSCILGREFYVIQISLEFSGLNLFEQLSTDPNAYLSSFLPGVGDLARYPNGSNRPSFSTLTAYTYPGTGVTVAIPSLSVKTKEVPEPNASVSILAFGTFGAGLLLRRGMTKKRKN